MLPLSLSGDWGAVRIREGHRPLSRYLVLWCWWYLRYSCFWSSSGKLRMITGQYPNNLDLWYHFHQFLGFHQPLDLRIWRLSSWNLVEVSSAIFDQAPIAFFYQFFWNFGQLTDWFAMFLTTYKVILNFGGFVLSPSKGCQIDNSYMSYQQQRFIMPDSLFRGAWLRFSLGEKDLMLQAWQLAERSLEHQLSFLPNNLSDWASWRWWISLEEALD